MQTANSINSEPGAAVLGVSRDRRTRISDTFGVSGLVYTSDSTFNFTKCRYNFGTFSPERKNTQLFFLRISFSHRKKIICSIAILLFVYFTKV